MSWDLFFFSCDEIFTWFLRIQAQFEHIAETYFDGFEHDVGERELGYAQTLDNDLDMFVASIGLTKTALEALDRDEGAYHIFSLPGGTVSSTIFLSQIFPSNLAMIFRPTFLPLCRDFWTNARALRRYLGSFVR